jgi:hypothetical protein
MRSIRVVAADETGRLAAWVENGKLRVNPLLRFTAEDAAQLLQEIEVARKVLPHVVWTEGEV